MPAPVSGLPHPGSLVLLSHKRAAGLDAGSAAPKHEGPPTENDGTWLQELVETAARVGRAIEEEWGRALDRCPPAPEALTATEQELRSCGFHLLALPEHLGGVGADLRSVAAVLRTMAHVDPCLAEWVLARTAAALPLVAHFASVGESPLADGWGCAWASGAMDTAAKAARLWVHGWVPGSTVVVARALPEGEVEFAGVETGKPVGLGATLGLRGCASAELALPQEGAELRVRVAREQVEEWGQQLLLWRAAIGLANARAALEQARQYAQTRHQGGARLVEHRTVQSLFAEPLAELLAAEALWERALEERRFVPWAAVLAGRAGEQACHAAQQVLGGYGYMRDYRVEHRLRDAKTLALRLGDGRRLLQDTVRPVLEGDEEWP